MNTTTSSVPLKHEPRVEGGAAAKRRESWVRALCCWGGRDFALCCESSVNQQLSGPPGAGVLPATNQPTHRGERSEPKSWGQIRELAVNVNAARSIERHVLPTQPAACIAP